MLFDVSVCDISPMALLDRGVLPYSVTNSALVVCDPSSSLRP